MKIAVLADIHGNLPALRAVLADVDAEAPDALVVAGDIVAGPLVRESLKAIDPRPEPTYWISGNSERDAVRVYDGEPASDDPPGRAAAWMRSSPRSRRIRTSPACSPTSPSHSSSAVTRTGSSSGRSVPEFATRTPLASAFPTRVAGVRSG